MHPKLLHPFTPKVSSFSTRKVPKRPKLPTQDFSPLPPTEIFPPLPPPPPTQASYLLQPSPHCLC